jgi:chemotaxis protein MotB
MPAIRGIRGKAGSDEKGQTMRSIPIILLSAALAAAIIFGLIFYQRSHNAQDALLASEERAAELSLKLSRLNEETAGLRDQIKELEGLRIRVSELEHAITQKDRAFSELNEAIRNLKRELAKERRSKQSIEAEFISQNVTLTKVQKRLRDAQARVRNLEEQLAEKDRELETIKLTLRTLRGEKVSAKASIDEMRSAYDSLVNDLKERIEQQEVSIERFEEEISVTFVDRILFDFGNAAITPEGRETLNRIGKTLQAVKGKRIRVVGHTDNRPIHPNYLHKFPSNWELSSARASAVIRYFQEELGLEPTRLEAVGRSFYDPAANNRTPEGRDRNRRVEIIIAPQLD